MAEEWEGHARVWTSNFGNRPGNPERCRYSVPDGGRSVCFHQCSRKPVVFRTLSEPAGVFGYCKQHDPVELHRRRKAEEAKWRAEWAARDAAANRREQIVKATADCIEALRQIEAGHNDPRALARDHLQRLDALSPKPGGVEPGETEE